MKIAVVYWSGTGNTEAMAQLVAEGISNAGGEAVCLTPSDFDPGQLDSYGAIAFGCPSMGAEQLEETEFEPMFQQCEPGLSGRRIALFGSYGWGDGQWMRDWADTCRAAGAQLVCEPVICCGVPDEDAAEACKALGAALVG